jgi:hypothetical protein
MYRARQAYCFHGLEHRIMKSLFIFFLLSFFLPFPALADDFWDTVLSETRDALIALADEYSIMPGSPAPPRPDPIREGSAALKMVIVPFSGPFPGSVVEKSARFPDTLEFTEQDNDGVLVLKDFGGQTRQVNQTDMGVIAARTTIRKIREEGNLSSGARQPLIIAVNHGRHAESIAAFANELAEEGMEVSLAVFVDTISWRNPQLPPTIRYAINFYQREGVIFGLPFRGRSRLVIQDPSRTTILGNYRVTPRADESGWSWNFLQPLLYRHHYLIGRDVRIRRYLQNIILLNRKDYEQLYDTEPADAGGGLFNRVVIMGASISAGEKADSPGFLLARMAGTPEDRVHVYAKGGAPSRYHMEALDDVARLSPSLIVAVDLFYHDFKFSLFLSEAKKEYLRDYVRKLHNTGAVVVIGNIPDLVLLRNEHVNRYFEELAEEFPKLVLLDVHTLNDRANGEGIQVNGRDQEVLLTRQDLFHDREHPNVLGSMILADIILQHLRMYEPDCCPELSLIDLSPFLSSDSR